MGIIASPMACHVGTLPSISMNTAESAAHTKNCMQLILMPSTLGEKWSISSMCAV